MNAHYFNGVDARLHCVTVTVADGRVAIDGTGIARHIDVASTSWSAPWPNAPAMLYLPDGALCEVHGADRAALATALGCHAGWHRWRYLHSLAAVLLLAALVAVATLAALHLFPAVAAFAVQVVPERVEQRQGRLILQTMIDQAMLQPSRLTPALARETEAVLAQVTPDRPRVPVHLHIAYAPAIDMNALALPDGTIVVTDQLIWSLLSAPDTMNAEGKMALAGMLAHEIGHLEARDGMRSMIERSLMRTLSAVLFGEVSDNVVALSTGLVALHYSHDRETAADTWAITRMHQLHLPLAPLAQWFDNVEAWYARTENRQRALPAYFNTHPASATRSARLRAADQR
ncbi:MAG: M48 family metallopeptidase [Pseudomonadota bacterium]|nr:M48 family metallopeptidase [Pseudomonadota bacterium]